MRIALSRNNSVLNTRLCRFCLVWLMCVTLDAMRLGLVSNTSLLILLVILYGVLSRRYVCDNIGSLKAPANAKIGLEISICLT